MSAHTTETQLRLIGKLLLEGELHCETGLHVGAGKGSLEIGSSDNPVIKDAFGRPYIPGSSLRGRLRSLLEQSSGLTVRSEEHTSELQSRLHLVCRLLLEKKKKTTCTL